MLPDLHLYTSNRLENLAQRLGFLMEEGPLSPFDSETIVAPTPGVACWLKMQLADLAGISMNHRFIAPEDFVMEMLNLLFPDVGDIPFLTREQLTWRIFGILPELKTSDGFEAVRTYLDQGGDLKLIQLSERLGALFDHYLVYRPDMIQEWDAGESSDDWQAILWRAISAKYGRSPHLGDLLERFRRDRPGEASLPKRVFLFGVSHLPPLYLDLLSIVGEFSNVHLFQLQPSPGFWGDILSRKELARLDASSEADSDFFAGNPLLASMGRQLREFSNLLLDRNFNPEMEPANPPERTNLLGDVQADIYGLSDGTAPDSEKRRFGREDDSISFSVCHGPMREVEVLRDYLLRLFDTIPDLRPREILVLTPKIDLYAPYIQAVFSVVQDRDQKIPFSVCDRGSRSDSQVADAFMRVLELGGRRQTSREIVGVIESPVVRRRFGFSEDELVLIRRWVAESGIRWGRDAAHRDGLDLGAFKQNSWEFGIERMLLGLAMRGENLHLLDGQHLPYDEIEGSRVDLLGRFLQVAVPLLEIAQDMERPKRISEWVADLRSILSSSIIEAEDTLSDLEMMRAVIGRLADASEVLGEEAEIEFAVVRHFLSGILARRRGASGFLSGGVTFAELMPMRSIPARVICLIGMDHRAFPRRTAALAFDRIANEPRKGDRSIRESDQLCFLETLLAAEERLYISYCGQSIQDNSESPPSVLVSELLDYLNHSVQWPDKGKGVGTIVRYHRLQSYSPAYFSEGELYSYSDSNAAAARSLRKATGTRIRFIENPLPEPEEEFREINLQQLVRFLANPSQHFIRERLGIRLFAEEPVLDESEPISLNGLEEFHIKEELVGDFLASKDAADARALNQARGVLPVGEPGSALFNRLASQSRAFAQRVAPALGSGQKEPFDFELEVAPFRLVGRLEPIEGSRLLGYRCAKINARSYLDLWCQHLVASALRKSDGGPALQVRFFALDATCSFNPIENPHEELRALLRMYWEGMCRPLPFFPKASRAFAEAQLGLVRARTAPLQRARGEWDGNQMAAGEKDDPFYQLVFGNDYPFDEEFKTLSVTVWETLLRNLVKEKP